MIFSESKIFGDAHREPFLDRNEVVIRKSLRIPVLDNFLNEHGFNLAEN